MTTRARTKATYDDGFLPLDELATYSGLSRRFLEDRLRDPLRPLPFYRVGEKIVVRRSEYDAWVQQFRVTGETVDFEAAIDAKIKR